MNFRPFNWRVFQQNRPISDLGGGTRSGLPRCCRANWDTHQFLDELGEDACFSGPVRPAGKTAQRSICGNVQSRSTTLTMPSLISGANIHSEAIAIPALASTAARTPSGSTHTQATLQRDRNFRVIALEGPVLTAASLVVNHGVVRREVAGRRGFTSLREIGRGTNNDLGPARDPPRCQHRVGKPPHPQSNIDPFVNEVDVTIVQHGLDSSSGCCARNSGKRGIKWMRANVTAAQTRSFPLRLLPAPRAANSASSASSIDRRARFVIVEARFSRRQSAGRAHQQFDTKPFLKLRHRFRHGRLSHVEAARGGGK